MRLSKRLLSLESLFFMFMFFWSLNPFLLFINGLQSELEFGEADTARQALWFAMYLVVLALTCHHWREVRDDFCRDRYLLLVLGFVSASLLWSPSPSLAFRRVP